MSKELDSFVPDESACVDGIIAIKIERFWPAVIEFDFTFTRVSMMEFVAMGVYTESSGYERKGKRDFISKNET